MCSWQRSSSNTSSPNASKPTNILKSVTLDVSDLINTSGINNVVLAKIIEKLEEAIDENGPFDKEEGEIPKDEPMKNMSIWIASQTQCFMINVYAPQDDSKKEKLWNDILDFMNMNRGHHLIFGDFNVVRLASERFGTTFNHASANAFNRFIRDAQLWDVPLGGHFPADSHWALPGLTYYWFIDFNTNVDGYLQNGKKSSGNIEADENPNFYSPWLTKTQVSFLLQGIKVDENLIDDPSGIKGAFHSFFEKKFQKIDVVKIVNRSPFYKSLTPEQNTLLTSPILETDIKDAIWDCGSDKSPGPDDSPFAFYKEF
ncbi:RNA-directed DNA polymerase, eukaryota, reverse transcriptase zinc-binding domain protein [Tanacetum coccineum]